MYGRLQNPTMGANGVTLFTAAVAMWRIPLDTWFTLSCSEPSWPPRKMSTWMRPPDSSSACFLNAWPNTP